MMNSMEITFAQYVADLDGNNISIRATIDGVEMFVPIAPGNRHYQAIMEAVEAGELIIQEAQ